MIDHGLFATILAMVTLVALAGNAALVCLLYRVHSMSERNDRLIAATYLEARRALEQHR